VVRVVRVALANLAYQVTQVDLAVHASQVVLADLLVQKTAVPHGGPRRRQQLLRQVAGRRRTSLT
jgi:hypothetical protein